MTSRNVPRLRFKGFSNKWNEEKFKNVFEKLEYGLSKSGKKFDGKHMYLRITDIDERTRRLITDDLVSPDIDFDNKKNNHYLLDDNDIVVARTGASTGKTYLYNKNDGKLYFAGYLIRGNVKKIFDSKFIFFNTLTWNYQKFIKIVSVRSGQPGINSNDYAGYNFFAPSLPEQQCIGKFLSKLDYYIYLQLEKIEQINNLKKSYVQKLFPRKGKSMPRLRFSDFSKDWKHVKIDDIVMHNTLRNRDLAINNVESVSNKEGFIKQTKQFNDYSVASKNLSNYIIVKPGMFAYNPSRINVGSIAFKDNDSKTSVVSPIYVSFKTNDEVYDDFLLYWFTTDSFKSQRQKYSEYGVRDTLSFKLLAGMDFYLPSLEEQKKIVMFLNNIDTLKEEQNRKIKYLEKLKKYYLQRILI